MNANYSHETLHDDDQSDPIMKAQFEEDIDGSVDIMPAHDNKNSDLFGNDEGASWLFSREKAQSIIDKSAKLYYKHLKKLYPSVPDSDWNSSSDPNYQEVLTLAMEHFFPNPDDKPIDPMENKRRTAIAERRADSYIRMQNNLPSYGEQLCLMDPSMLQKALYPTSEQVIATIAPFVNKLDKNMLTEIKKLMDQDITSGSKELVAYLSEVLGIVVKPTITINNCNKASWVRGGYEEKPNHIIINHFPGDVTIDAIYGAVIHEMWHVHQNNIINFGREEDSTNRRLYLINKEFHLPGFFDTGGYIDQIIEKEAFAFEAAVAHKVIPNELSEYYDQRKAVFEDFYEQSKIKSIIQRIKARIGRKDK